MKPHIYYMCRLWWCNVRPYETDSPVGMGRTAGAAYKAWLQDFYAL
jgi:hypothetical protein